MRPHLQNNDKNGNNDNNSNNDNDDNNDSDINYNHLSAFGQRPHALG